MDAWGDDLYGMCLSLIPAMVSMSTAAITDVGAAEPYDSVPGRCLAASMTSLMLRKGELAAVTRVTEVCPKRATGSKSRTGSYETFSIHGVT